MAGKPGYEEIMDSRNSIRNSFYLRVSITAKRHIQTQLESTIFKFYTSLVSSFNDLNLDPPGTWYMVGVILGKE